MPGSSRALRTLAARTPDAASLWRDYEERAVFYNGLLIEVGELAPDVEAGQGFIPADIARRVHQYPLDLSLMRASLRGYQAFGAKFALCQERAMLGDEMGLGKSVEALAAMCHLHVEGRRHFLVVCPASVLVNWTHEIHRHSELRAYRLHGPDRQRNFQAWTRAGGVAVTTYDSLRSLPRTPGIDLGLLVVDEAHYAKNAAPSAPRQSGSGRGRPAGSCSSPALRWKTGSRNSGSWSATFGPTFRACQQRGRPDRRWSFPDGRRAGLPAPEPVRCAGGASSPGRYRGVGRAKRPRSGSVPACRRRG